MRLPFVAAVQASASCQPGQGLIASGHSGESAEDLARRHPAWNTAPVRSVDAFARAQCRLWETIAAVDRPDGWTQKLHAAAQAWAERRA